MLLVFAPYGVYKDLGFDSRFTSAVSILPTTGIKTKKNIKLSAVTKINIKNVNKDK
jgi:hypothetical protein